MKVSTCSHLASANLRVRAKTSAGCEECLRIGDEWVSLRLCLTCGHVGCCDDSKNKHATKHFKVTRHPIMRGYKTKHRFKWCFVDKLVV